MAAVLAIAGAVTYFMLSAGGNKSGLNDGEYEYVDMYPESNSDNDTAVVYEEEPVYDSAPVEVYYDDGDVYAGYDSVAA